MTMQFDMDTFVLNTNCTHAINAEALGYDPSIDGHVFTFEVDVHTLFAALAANYGINGPGSLGLFQKIDRFIEAQPYKVSQHFTTQTFLFDGFTTFILSFTAFLPCCGSCFH
jgi:hypothetical protein